MLFKNDESYLIADVQNRCGFRSRPEAEAALEENHVVGVPIGTTIAYHGQSLNNMILRMSSTFEDRGTAVQRRSQKRNPSGKFAATACPKCSAKMSRGVCPECG
ncbi:MAG: hypothetical protein AAGJ40_02935 [Planctomycetota bacterium]